MKWREEIYRGDSYNIEYRKISDISRTKSQNLNDSRLVVLQLTLPNPLKPGVKSRMKM